MHVHNTRECVVVASGARVHLCQCNAYMLLVNSHYWFLLIASWCHFVVGIHSYFLNV